MTSEELASDEIESAAVKLRVCKCGNDMAWADCYNCGGEGFSDHDCGEDCCCCLNPEDNVECDICDGNGGWWACPTCEPRAFDEY